MVDKNTKQVTYYNEAANVLATHTRRMKWRHDAV